MSTYEEMVANRDRRIIELAATRLEKFYKDVERHIRAEELTQLRNECFEELTTFISRTRAIHDIDLVHRLDVTEWGGRQLPLGYLPARNICAMVMGRWVVQYFLTCDPFQGRPHYIYTYVFKWDGVRRVGPGIDNIAQLIPYMSSNYILQDDHPRIVVEELEKLCNECQTEIPATAS